MGRRDEDIEEDVPRRRRSRDDNFEDRPPRSRSRERYDDDDDRPRRRRRDDEEDDDRPRRRHRDDEDDDDRPRRTKSKKGLIIGLIAGGAGLIVVVVVVILVLVLSGGGLKTQIVGKWREENGTGTYEFAADEVFRYTRRGINFTSRYRVIDNTTVEVPVPAGVGAGRLERVHVEINGDVLTANSLEHPERRPLRLRRVHE